MKVSVIIAARRICSFLLDKVLVSLSEQTFKDFEVIVVVDEIGRKEKLPGFLKVVVSKKGPGEKRDLGVEKAKGEIVAFIDDDVVVSKNWLKRAVFHFRDNKIAGVGGPGVTPEDDSLEEKASGWVYSSLLGGGGAGRYRAKKGKKRYVDDYPAFNLLVRKKDFEEVGGFKTDLWPGEDTKLCLKLVGKLRKKIIYDPKVLVYHHRKKVFGAHLEQIKRVATQRGYFVKKYPETSARLRYFLPSFFVAAFFMVPVMVIILEFFQLCAFSIPLFLVYLGSIFIYVGLLLGTGIMAGFKEKSAKLAILVILAILATHFVYGIFFIKGFLGEGLRKKV